jgi:FkbM family methyltransferase
MQKPPRPQPFVLVATDHGPMILNHLDYQAEGDRTFGVGHEILRDSSFCMYEAGIATALLDWRRERYGDGVVAVDCGANIGVMTVEWARHMTGWGEVLAIEAQERIYYALAGNICLNNCFNARALHAAVGNTDGELKIPQPDYCRPGSFGSLELKPRSGGEFIGQQVSYAPETMRRVIAFRLDSTQLPRVDLIKIDVEGMEEEVLRGAEQTIARCKPYLLVEHYKLGAEPLTAVLTRMGYRVWEDGMNLVCVPDDDPNAARIAVAAPKA